MWCTAPSIFLHIHLVRLLTCPLCLLCHCSFYCFYWCYYPAVANFFCSFCSFVFVWLISFFNFYYRTYTLLCLLSSPLLFGFFLSFLPLSASSSLVLIFASIVTFMTIFCVAFLLICSSVCTFNYALALAFKCVLFFIKKDK